MLPHRGRLLSGEAAGIDTIWVNERLSTPAGMGWAPEDGGRYLDCLMALTFIAARSERIRLGTGVLNVPYHLPFQLVKQVATLPLEDVDAATEMAQAFAAAGCDEFVHAGGYADVAAYRQRIDVPAQWIIPAVA